MPTQTIFLQSCHDGIPIETRITYNGNTKNTASAPAVILAHPYGPLGGNMDNNVVVALHRYFSSKGYITASLNFRGSGNSKGRTSWTGMAERGDYQAVIHHLIDDAKPVPSSIIISGYSFGSMVAASMEPPPNIPHSYLLISYPLGVQWALATIKSSFFAHQVDRVMANENAFIVVGDRDNFTGVRSYRRWLEKQKGDRLDYVVVEDVDHFWFGKEETLVDKVNAWIEHKACPK
ncbi:Alpha/Beta hydrolase protein [Dichotomocladium elegans]|nr:Alpha/Beta hydrolase protein [Dichotomocladium elegans]